MAAAQVSAAVFLVIDQEFPSIRNAQRYIAFLMRMGFNQDQIRVVVNRYTKKVTANHGDPGADPADFEPAGVLRNSAVAGGDRLHQQGPGRSWPTANRRGDLDRVFRAFVDKATGGRKAKPAATSEKRHNRKHTMGSRSVSGPDRAPTVGSK